MTQGPLVSVCLVVATEQNIRDLEDCLPALRAQTHKLLEVVVVSNAAPVGWDAAVRRLYPEAKLIEAGDNLGYAGGNNLGIRASTGTYFMALNPDVILASGFVKAMVDALSSSPTAGFANGRLYTRRDVTVPGQEGKRIIDVTWLSIEKRRRQFCPYQFKEDCAELDRPRNVFGADGAAPMFKREMLEDVRIGEDYYDPAFFSGKEDLDISWRARLFGWDCLYVPTAVAYHRRTFTPVDKRRSVPKAFRIASIRNRYLVMIRNDLLQLWLRDLPRILWYDFLILSHVILREPESLRAYFDVVRLLPLQLRKRREIMQRRRASVEEMAQWFV